MPQIPRLHRLAIIASLLLLPHFAHATIQTRTVPISYGKDASGTDLTGECTLAWDDAFKTPRPGVLVFPEWWGLNDYSRSRTQQLASLGYVALGVDIYGNAQTTTDPKRAGELASIYKDNRPLFRARVNKALATFIKLREVDAARIAAIGYCFGGTAALELARSGANIRSIVSFHGDLSTPTPADARSIKAKILVCHGAIDPYVPKKVVDDFQAEMAAANTDYVFSAYAGAVHAFTNPAAGNDPAKGMAYNRLADTRSWQAMQDFLGETLK